MAKKQFVREGKCFPTENKLCPNCDASMLEYVYEVDIFHVLLLTAMAKELQNRLDVSGPSPLDFTVANQIHVPTLPVSHATKCRTTQAAKLGLIAKMRGKGSQGVWVITQRGFDGLAGAEIPAMVKVFRNEVVEWLPDVTTFSKAKTVHIEAVESAILRRKDPKHDHRKELEGYRPEEWFRYGSVHQGKLIN